MTAKAMPPDPADDAGAVPGCLSKFAHPIRRPEYPEERDDRTPPEVDALNAALRSRRPECCNARHERRPTTVETTPQYTGDNERCC